MLPLMLDPGRSRPALSSLAAALALAACGGRPGRPAPLAPPATVRVVNRTTRIATVWVARDSAHQRLGSVAATATAEWAIPRSFMDGRDSVRFLALRADTACVQQARFALGKRRRFTMVLKSVFVNAAGGRKEPCRW